MQKMAARIVTLADDEYLISYNGARVVRALSGSIVFEWSLDQETIDAAITYAREHNLYIQGYADEQVVTEGTTPDAAERMAMYEGSTGMAVRRVRNLREHIGAPTPKLLIIGDEQEMLHHREILSAHPCGNSRVTLSKANYLEFVHPQVSKGAALTRLAAELAIPIEETVAVGDSYNDIEMIEAAGLGVAVANARPELKALAGVVLERSSGDGAIEELADRFFS
jgi:Cof subfamily protein (haloacid dehalogenase superfamily)